MARITEESILAANDAGRFSRIGLADYFGVTLGGLRSACKKKGIMHMIPSCVLDDFLINKHVGNGHTEDYVLARICKVDTASIKAFRANQAMQNSAVDMFLYGRVG